MTEQDDPKQPSKKIAINDMSGGEPTDDSEGKAAPENMNESTPAEPDLEPDAQTSKAVDDMMAMDPDDTPKPPEAPAEKPSVMKPAHTNWFKACIDKLWGSPRRRWMTIGTVVLVVAALFAVPFTRFNILGLVLSAPVTVHAVDSKTGKPVSGATVELAGKTAETNADGVAVLHVHAGSKTLQVSKKYYTGVTGGKLVALSGNDFKAPLLALGRQVNLKVINKITGKPVVGATVTASGATTKTNANGLATLVLGSGVTVQEANVTLAGYNTSKVSITAAGDLAKNTFTVTPAGKLYFLSNLSGKIDVVKTNLDGTERQTVLAGTGSEDKNSTSLLASRDWKYLALLSKRSGDKASVYLIDTTNGDKLTTVDEGDAQFSLVGWSGDRFVYQVVRNTVSDWQPNQQAIKSLDPTTGHTLLIDQTQGSGTSKSDYTKQFFGTSYLIGDQVVYLKGWTGTSGVTVATKQAELDTIGADGSGHKVVKTFSMDAGIQSTYLSAAAELYEPGGLYITFDNGNGTTFYDYENGKVTDDTTMTNEKFYSVSYSTYLLSPSGSSTFWSELRDGKNALFVGDASGKAAKQVASLSDYNTYAWYTDDYLLVSKNSSEVYVLPVGGGTPLKITDYYKPAISYNGYGGGYGGL